MKKIINFIKEKKKTFVILSITLGLFLILSLLIALGKFVDIDSVFHSYILTIRNDDLTSLFKIITNFAGATFLLALTFIILLFRKKNKTSLYILLNLVFSFIVNESVKGMFARSRPVGINLIDEIGYSFPSGHTMVAFSVYGFLVYLLCRKTKKLIVKIILVSVLFIGVFLIGFSRIYLGVHYFSDIIGGFLLSIIYLTIFTNVIRLEKK